MRRRQRGPGVWVRCAECGRQRLPLHAITLQQCESPVRFTVTWRCRRCRRVSVTHVEPDDVRRLARAGVRAVIWRMPRELIEPRPIAPAIRADDLLEWHERLTTPGWLESEVAKLRGVDPHRT